eukprot:g1456.t1
MARDAPLIVQVCECLLSLFGFFVGALSIIPFLYFKKTHRFVTQPTNSASEHAKKAFPRWVVATFGFSLLFVLPAVAYMVVPQDTIFIPVLVVIGTFITCFLGYFILLKRKCYWNNFLSNDDEEYNFAKMKEYFTSGLTSAQADFLTSFAFVITLLFVVRANALLCSGPRDERWAGEKGRRHFVFHQLIVTLVYYLCTPACCLVLFCPWRWFSVYRRIYALETSDSWGFPKIINSEAFYGVVDATSTLFFITASLPAIFLILFFPWRWARVVTEIIAYWNRDENNDEQSTLCCYRLLSYVSILWRNMCLGIIEAPFVLASLLIVGASLYRVRGLWSNFSFITERGRNFYNIGVMCEHIGLVLLDIPFLFLTLPVALSIYRLPMLCKCMLHHQDARSRRRTALFSFVMLILDFPAFLCAVIVAVTGYRMESAAKRLRLFRLIQKRRFEEETVLLQKLKLVGFRRGPIEMNDTIVERGEWYEERNNPSHIGCFEFLACCSIPYVDYYVMSDGRWGLVGFSNLQWHGILLHEGFSFLLLDIPCLLLTFVVYITLFRMPYCHKKIVELLKENKEALQKAEADAASRGGDGRWEYGWSSQDYGGSSFAGFSGKMDAVTTHTKSSCICCCTPFALGNTDVALGRTKLRSLAIHEFCGILCDIPQIVMFFLCINIWILAGSFDASKERRRRGWVNESVAVRDDPAAPVVVEAGRTENETKVREEKEEPTTDVISIIPLKDRINPHCILLDEFFSLCIDIPCCFAGFIAIVFGIFTGRIVVFYNQFFAAREGITSKRRIAALQSFLMIIPDLIACTMLLFIFTLLIEIRECYRELGKIPGNNPFYFLLCIRKKEISESNVNKKPSAESDDRTHGMVEMKEMEESKEKKKPKIQRVSSDDVAVAVSAEETKPSDNEDESSTNNNVVHLTQSQRKRANTQHCLNRPYPANGLTFSENLKITTTPGPFHSLLFLEIYMLVTDVPTVLLLSLNILFFWRWCDLVQNVLESRRNDFDSSNADAHSWRKCVLQETMEGLYEIPFIFTLLPMILCMPWRFCLLIRDMQNSNFKLLNEQRAKHRRKAAIHQIVLGLCDYVLVIPSFIILVTVYRAAPMMQHLREFSLGFASYYAYRHDEEKSTLDTKEEKSTLETKENIEIGLATAAKSTKKSIKVRRIRERLEAHRIVWKQFLQLLTDLPFILLLLLISVTGFWRIPIVIHLLALRWNDGDEKRRETIFVQTMMVLADIPFFLAWLIQLPFLHRSVPLILDMNSITPKNNRSCFLFDIGEGSRASTRYAMIIDSLLLLLLDVILFFPFLILSVSIYRLPSDVKFFTSSFRWKGKNRFGFHSTIVREFVELIVDIPFVVLAMIITFTHRSYQLWTKLKAVRDDINGEGFCCCTTARYMRKKIPASIRFSWLGFRSKKIETKEWKGEETKVETMKSSTAIQRVLSPKLLPRGKTMCSTLDVTTGRFLRLILDFSDEIDLVNAERTSQAFFLASASRELPAWRRVMLKRLWQAPMDLPNQLSRQVVLQKKKKIILRQKEIEERFEKNDPALTLRFERWAENRRSSAHCFFWWIEYCRGGRGVVLWETTMFILDLPFIVLALMTFISVWRVPRLLIDILHRCKNAHQRRMTCFVQFCLALLDIPGT